MPAENPCAPGAPEAPEAPDAQGTPRAPGPEPRLSSQLLPELYGFVARVLFYLAPVYLAGYLGLSVTWLLLGALLWRWWRRNRRGKLGRLAAAFEFLDNERQFISRELLGQHLPAWVSRPGGQGAEVGVGGPWRFGRSLRCAGGLGRGDPREGRSQVTRTPGPPRARLRYPGGRDRAPPAPHSHPHLWFGCAGRGNLGFIEGPRAWERSHGRATPRRKTRAPGPLQSSPSGGRRPACWFEERTPGAALVGTEGEAGPEAVVRGGG